MYELLEPGQTIIAVCYKKQIINLNHALKEKRPQCAKRYTKVFSDMTMFDRT